MLVRELVDTSAAVAATRSRLRKTELLSALLRRLGGGALPVAVGLLTASPAQGRVGVGWATLSGVLDALPERGGEPLEVGRRR